MAELKSTGTRGDPEASGGTEIPDKMFCKSDNWIGGTFPDAEVALLVSVLLPGAES